MHTFYDSSIPSTTRRCPQGIKYLSATNQIYIGISLMNITALTPVLKMNKAYSYSEDNCIKKVNLA